MHGKLQIQSGTKKMLITILKLFNYLHKEGDIGVCGVAVLISFLCGIPMNKIPHCVVAVISNPTVCDVCAFKPTVFGEMKLFTVLRHQQY